MPGLDNAKTNLKPYTVETATTRYRAVKLGSVTGAVVPVTGATDKVVGFSIEDGAVGETKAIAMDGGQIYAEAGAAILVDADLTIDASGRVVTAAPSAGTNVQWFGKAREAAGAAGDVIPIMYARGVFQG